MSRQQWMEHGLVTLQGASAAPAVVGSVGQVPIARPQQEKTESWWHHTQLAPHAFQNTSVSSVHTARELAYGNALGCVWVGGGPRNVGSRLPEGGTDQDQTESSEFTILVPHVSTCFLQFQWKGINYLGKKNTVKWLIIATLKPFVIGDICICHFRSQCQKHKRVLVFFRKTKPGCLSLSQGLSHYQLCDHWQAT